MGKTIAGVLEAGHSTDISEIKRSLSAVLAKRTVQAFCLWGEPGVGKSHLARALLRETPCQSFVLRAQKPDLSELLSLPQDSPQRLWERLQRGEPLEPAKLAEGLSALLAQQAPVVVLLEDVHEAGPIHLELAHHLARILSRTRGVGLLVTGRSPLPEPFRNHRLLPLSRPDSDRMLGEHLPEEGLEWVFERARGNPLFSLEYLRYLVRQGFFWSDGNRWRWRIPPREFVPVSVEALIGQLAEQLCPDALTRRVLETRALLGDPTDEKTWAAVAEVDLETLHLARQTLERGGLLRDREFTHPLFAPVLRQELHPEQRKGYAARALEALEAAQLEPPVWLVADAQTGECHPRQTYRRLAEQARSRGDRARAGHWLALASEGADGPEQTRLALEAAELLRHSDLARATRLAQRVASQPPHDPEAVFLSAELWVAQGETEQAETILGLLPPAEQQGQRLWETRIRLYYSTHAGHPEVLRLWEAHPEFQSQAHPEIVLFVSSVTGQRGDFDAALARSAPLLERLDLEPFLRARVLELQATLSFLKSNFISSEAFNTQAVALARTLERPTYLAKLLRKQAIDAQTLGKLSEATAHYKEALQLYSEHGPLPDFANTQAALAVHLVDLGEYEEAETLLLQAQEVAERSENKLLRCDCQVGLALLYLEWKPPYGGPLALKHARLALAYARETGNQQMIHAALIHSAHAEARYGSFEKALELAQESAQDVHTAASAQRKARSDFALGMALEAAGKTQEALAALEHSCQQYERLGMHKMANRYGLEADRISQNPESARKRHAWFAQQGLPGGARIALRYFPALEAPQPIPTPSGPRLNLLGPAQLEKNGERIAYRGRKRLEFLVYLLETRISGRSEASLLDLVDALYPSAGEAEAKAVIKQLTYLLRNQLGSEAILSTPGGYALGAVTSDVEEFLQTPDTRLWRGPYRAGLEENGSSAVRETLLQTLQSQLSTTLSTDPGEALRLGQIWLEMEPYELEAIHLTVRAYQAVDDLRGAERVYREGCQRLAEVGERLPASLERFLEETAPMV